MKKNKISLGLVLILGASLFTSCGTSEKYQLVFHTYSEYEINSKSLTKKELDYYQLPSPIKDGYNFEGWYLNQSYTNPYSVDLISKNDTIIELYAKYSVSEYNLNIHHSINQIENIKINYNDNIELTPPEKEGYYFDGWFLDPMYKNALNFVKMPSKDLDLYPKWNVVPDKETTLVFYSDSQYICEPIIVDESSKDNLLLPKPSKVGYKFDGWYLDNKYENKFNSSELSFDKNIVLLFAKFDVEKYDLSLHYYDEESYSQEIEYGNKLNLPTPERDGYYFDGWFLDENYNTPFSYEYMPNTSLNVFAKWSEVPTYKVTIYSVVEDAVSFNGKVEQYIDSTNKEFENVVINDNLGYKFKYYEIDGVKYHSNEISLKNIKSDIEIKVYSEYATYELPIINIDTGGAPIDSKEDYTDMSFSISNCEGELENIVGGIRLRGNSTRRFDKKPFRMKFDKKQSLFGLEKAKSWVLLAEYLDPSGLHNYTAFKLASEMDGLSFTPTPNKVNVYLNNEFIGLYTLCEQVQENEGRMNIEVDITDEMVELKDFNFFISMDYSVIEDSTAILNETYYYIEEYDKYFEIKYPEKSQFVSEEQFERFFNELVAYTKDLLDIFSNKDVNKIKEEVNVNSLVDYLIVDQIMGEQDHAHKSFNMYHTCTSENESENNKINFGPIWDYDWSLYTPWSGKPNESYNISNAVNFSNVFFKGVAAIPELFGIVKERYSSTMSNVLNDYISTLYKVEASITESVELNRIKWYSELDENISINNIDFLNRYLLNRKLLLDKLWAN